MSVTKVTWYYWGQNRYGNFLPLVASWISDIDANYL
jgi:hypothetical protein